MLAALLLCAHGAPVETALTDNPAGEFSGEGQVESSNPQNTSTAFTSVLDLTVQHKNHFEDEFKNAVSYDSLDDYKPASLPPNCPASNFSKEACLRRLVEGLQIYTVLLKYVESEFPTSHIKSQTGKLIESLKQKMKNSERVTALTSVQEEELLKNLNNSKDTYLRKMTAYCILSKLHWFVVDGKRAIDKREDKAKSRLRSTSTVNTF
ncbi:interleukin-6-like [Anabas testudineus]|uniref:interleukin-6-like n=1 Tax=Anabas testudineus TaxID=64144 RepID=UPI00143CF24B|nr:interleukin-6-like [Anabas testudineus]